MGNAAEETGEGDEDALAREDVQSVRMDEAGHSARFWQSWNVEAALEWVNSAYTQIVSFSQGNLFDPPKCGATKTLVEEMTLLIRAYTNTSHAAPLALKTLAVLPHLMLQRTHRKSKGSENVKAVQRRIELWKKGEVKQLLSEAVALQERLIKGKSRDKETTDKNRIFGETMRQGKVSKAIRFLSSQEDAAGVLPMTDGTRRMLKDKHPDALPAPQDSKLPGEYLPPHHIVFDRITGDAIWRHALHTHGAAGPSGMDANSWKSLLSKNTAGNAAIGLRDAIATLARKMATEDCQHLDAITACRLIPLDKKPGCRPIGIGEVLRRVMGKAIMEVVKEDVKRAVGNLQVCAGQRARCEAAIHAVKTMFADPECEAVLMVDASNAFNSLNREAAIHNIKVRCPSLAKYVENSYKVPAQLFICGEVVGSKRRVETLLSSEGTTQGDPVAMAMYALGLLKLQHTLRHNITRVKQVAYADDLTGVGKVADLKKWWELVMEHGPKLGYFPNPRKSVIIVKPEKLEQAEELLRGSGIRVTKDGERHLGAVVGSETFKEDYIKVKVNEWTKEIVTLAEVAKTEPQAAYSAFTHGIRNKWNYLMRTVPNISDMFLPLENAIRRDLVPALCNGRCVNDIERKTLELPPRLGGLGIPNPVNMAQEEFSNSLKLTANLTALIVSQTEQSQEDMAESRAVRKEISRQRENKQKEEVNYVLQHLPETKRRLVEMAQEVGASNWLTALPLRAKGFTLNKKDFTDAIALRYGWPLDDLPDMCSCGAAFDATHAMVCKKGGFVCMRHDEVRDITAQMLKEACHDVATEPLLLPLQEEQLIYQTANTSRDARVDISARGFWTRGQRAFFDIRIFDPTARSHRNLSLEAAHRRNEQEKSRAYEERILHVDHGSFTPLVFTTSGGMAPRARVFYGRLAEVLADRRQQPRSNVVSWMRCRLSFSLLRSALVCLRGSRSTVPQATHVADLDFEVAVVNSRMDKLW